MTLQPCRRCKQSPSALVVRTEPLCKACFARYVHTKAIKRLESFRVNFAAAPDQQRRVLLPLSFGVSSTTLLHILDLHLKTQRAKTGRTGFNIHVLYVQDSNDESASTERLETTREQYPDHHYASLPLHHLFQYLPNDSSIRALAPTQSTQHVPNDPQARLSHMISSLNSATARADVLSTLRARLIVEYAKQTGCESVLWGDSTTRLAEKTLSETAKGRGFSLPWHVSDGQSPFGLKFHYPLRDVLKRELVSYVDLSDSDLLSIVDKATKREPQASVSSKSTTIDDLMKQYFESVEENFPSIVSNVVRTTSKLVVPAGSEHDPKCNFCGMPVAGARFGIHQWGGDQHEQAEGSTLYHQNSFCYGCTRSVPVSAIVSGNR